MQFTVRRFESDPALRDRILSGVGLSPEEAQDPNTEIVYTQLGQLYENMGDIFGAGWVIDFPELWRPTAHGALSVACLSAPTVGAAMAIQAAYMSARFAVMRFASTRESGALVLRPASTVPLSESLSRTYAELNLLGVSALLETLAGAARAQAQYEFRVARPAYAERMEAALGAEVLWGASSNAAVIPERLLQLRSPSADAGLHEAAIERLEATLRSRRKPEGVKGRVERLLARSETGRLPVEVVAASLGLSRRTLVRRLAAADLNYRVLVDAELKTRARRWLDSGALSKADIADRLGFADLTSFSRALRRWFKSQA